VKEEALLQTPSLPEAMHTRDLMRELSSNSKLLFQRQVKLAQIEAKEQARSQKTVAEILGAAGIVGYAGVIVLLVAAALAVGSALGDRFWLGALIIGGGFLLIAGILAPIGWVKRERKPLPRSQHEINEELTWARHQLT
jgi:hypothetical protein